MGEEECRKNGGTNAKEMNESILQTRGRDGLAQQRHTILPHSHNHMQAIKCVYINTHNYTHDFMWQMLHFEQAVSVNF